MQQKNHAVTITFVTKTGVQVTRTIVLRDTFRANAIARAKRLLPQGAQVTTVHA